MSELVAANLKFRYGERTVLNQLNLQVIVGELVVIRGANASGKTTLLKLLAGLLAPAEGSVTVSGAPLAQKRDLIGLLFQNPDQQMMAPTVEEELALGLEMRGYPVSDMRQRVEELLSEFDLRELAAKPPEALSGGQKQRVALAAIMSARPQFLLLDEPDSFLDAKSRRQLHSALLPLRATCGMIWTASRTRALPADRVLILENGRLTEDQPAVAGTMCG